MQSSIVRNPDLLLLPTGKDGVLYNSAYFSPGVLDYQTARRLAPTADDIWFKWHTAMSDVSVYLATTDYRRSTLASIDDGGASLYLKFNKDGGNDAIIGRIHQWAKTERSFDIVATAEGQEGYKAS